MQSQPAVIVLACTGNPDFEGLKHKLTRTLGSTDVLTTSLHQALASHLPVVVVTTRDLADHVALQVAASDMVVISHTEAGAAIAAGVSARSNASGWLIVPAEMPFIKAASLCAVGQALEQHPAAYAQHLGVQGYPIGFAAELYSELMTLTGDQTVRRLLARYPARAVEVDDVGVLLDCNAHDPRTHASKSSAHRQIADQSLP